MTDASSTAGLTVIHGAAELVVDPDEGTGVVVLEDTALAAFDGEVVAVDPTAEVLVGYLVEDAETTIDMIDKTVLPGLVDPHIHALFAGGRPDEFVAELQDVTYEDILIDGGGILRTVDAVHGVSDDELAAALADHLDAMLAYGATTVEVRTDYGLDTETELWMLSVIDAASSDHLVGVIPTFMGAYAVPRGADVEEHTESIISDQLPVVAAQGIAEFCDVFCERDVFIAEQSRRILDAGRGHGLTPKIHADEFAAIGGTDVTTSVGAVGADHLLHTDDGDRDTSVDAGAMPVLLPGITFSLGADYADARAFPGAGHGATLATDFSSSCFARSTSFVATLTSVGMRMTPHEAIRGVMSTTTDALNRDDGTGTLRTRAPVDAVVLGVSTASYLSYRFGTNPVSTMLKSGAIARE